MPPKKRKPTAAKLKCPECGFQAKHAMGLGRHRSAQHNVVSQRQQRMAAQPMRRDPMSFREPSPPGWLTRREASERAGVHYNTIRIWERAGKVRTQRRGIETLVSEPDFEKVVAQRGSVTFNKSVSSNGSGLPKEAVRQLADLNQRMNELADGLEALAKHVRPRKRRGRPPKVS